METQDLTNLEIPTVVKKPRIEVRGATLTKFVPKLVGPKECPDQIVELTISIPIPQVDWAALQSLWQQSAILNLEGRQDPLPIHGTAKGKQEASGDVPVADGQLHISDAEPHAFSIYLDAMPLEAKQIQAAETYLKKLTGKTTVAELRLDVTQRLPAMVVEVCNELDKAEIEAKARELGMTVRAVAWKTEQAPAEGSEFVGPMEDDEVETVGLEVLDGGLNDEEVA